MNILITGGTGFIGKSLIPALMVDETSHLTILTRDKSTQDKASIDWIEDLAELDNGATFDVVINLAGAPIDKRWSVSYKKTIIESRIGITKSLYQLIERLETKPKHVISASAIGFYGAQGHNTVTEISKPHPEFTHDLCREWEEEAQKIETLGPFVSIMRLGVVLGRGGGILKKLSPPFKLGLGGKIGSGQQFLSWVHMDDVVAAILFMMQQNKSGVYNLTAPHPVTNLEWAKALADAVKRPAIFPMPACVVKTLFGEMGERLLLNGQNVIPENLQKAGFTFQYPKIDMALADLIS